MRSLKKYDPDHGIRIWTLFQSLIRIRSEKVPIRIREGEKAVWVCCVGQCEEPVLGKNMSYLTIVQQPFYEYTYGHIDLFTFFEGIVIS